MKPFLKLNGELMLLRCRYWKPTFLPEPLRKDKIMRGWMILPNRVVTPLLPQQEAVGFNIEFINK